MRIFVISLPTQSERRAYIRAQFERMGVEFAFFDAVDARRKQVEYFRAFDIRRFQLNTGRNPLTTEIGCYASHLMLWRTCMILGEPIIILEDDACLDDLFATAMTFVERRIETLGFVRLETNPKSLGPTVTLGKSFSAQYCHSYPFSAMAYAISPSVAQTFVEQSDVFHSPVDKFIKDFWVHGQPLYQLSPHVVRESDLGVATSTIGTRRFPARRRLASRARRTAYKVRCSLNRLRFNVGYLLQRQLI
ncbi:MAG: glycosyltransferase family 25 protein [Woeseiaceae bacterium]|nr:glycosyltransferase family 25 protein [Woeseiaceae bacterium]